LALIGLAGETGLAGEFGVFTVFTLTGLLGEFGVLTVFGSLGVFGVFVVFTSLPVPVVGAAGVAEGVLAGVSVVTGVVSVSRAAIEATPTEDPTVS